MSNVSSKPSALRPAPGSVLDVGELGSAQTFNGHYAPRTRLELSPGEEAASLPSAWRAYGISFQSLNEYLGPLLTVANPVWGSEALVRMRSLQKRLIAHSLALEGDDRPNLMAAISTVEDAVQMRLRLEQMQMADEDLVPLSVPGVSNLGASITGEKS